MSADEWTDEQRQAVAEVLEKYAAEVKAGTDGPRDLDGALDAIWSTVSQRVELEPTIQVTDSPALRQQTIDRASRDVAAEERVTHRGRTYRKFIAFPEAVTDGTTRCMACGQIDEPEVHDDDVCPALGGRLTT